MNQSSEPTAVAVRRRTWSWRMLLAAALVLAALGMALALDLGISAGRPGFIVPYTLFALLAVLVAGLLWHRQSQPAAPPEMPLPWYPRGLSTLGRAHPASAQAAQPAPADDTPSGFQATQIVPPPAPPLPGLMALIDLEHRCLAVSPDLARWLGTQRDGLVGLDIVQVFGAEFEQQLRAKLVSAMEGRLRRLRCLHVDANGLRRWLQIELQPRQDAFGERVGCDLLAMDVTPEQQRLEKLIRHERRTRHLMAHMRVPVVYLSADLVVRFVNQAEADWQGQAEDQILGRLAAEVMGAEWPALAPQILAALAGERVDIRRSRPLPNGQTQHQRGQTLVDQDDQGRTAGLFVVFEDDSERHVLAERLHSATDQLQQVRDELLPTAAPPMATAAAAAAAAEVGDTGEASATPTDGEEEAVPEAVVRAIAMALADVSPLPARADKDNHPPEAQPEAVAGMAATLAASEAAAGSAPDAPAVDMLDDGSDSAMAPGDPGDVAGAADGDSELLAVGAAGSITDAQASLATEGAEHADTHPAMAPPASPPSPSSPTADASADAAAPASAEPTSETTRTAEPTQAPDGESGDADADVQACPAAHASDATAAANAIAAPAAATAPSARPSVWSRRGGRLEPTPMGPAAPSLRGARLADGLNTSYRPIGMGRVDASAAPAATLVDAIELAVHRVAPAANSRGIDLACRFGARLPGPLSGDGRQMPQRLEQMLRHALSHPGVRSLLVDISRLDDRHLSLSVTLRRTNRPATASEPLHQGQDCEGMPAAWVQQVNAAGGHCGVDTEPGTGQRLWFTWPIEAAATGVAAAAGAAASGEPALSGHVLVVDDCPDQREILTQRLAESGLDCSSADSGAQALRRLQQARQAGEPVHLVLLDATLPDAKAAQLALQILRQETATPPAMVLMDASADPSAWAAAAEAGVAARLEKPLRRRELYRTLRGLLRPDGASIPNLNAPATAGLGLHGAPAKATGPAMAARPSLPLVHARVLYAEADAANQARARTMLSALGCDFDIVGTGVEAIKAVEREHFDLLLLECSMADVGGPAVCRTLRDRERRSGLRKRVPVIGLIDDIGGEEQAACVAAGMDDWLIKPLDREQFTEGLARWLPPQLIERPAPSPDEPPPDGQPPESAPTPRQLAA